MNDNSYQCRLGFKGPMLTGTQTEQFNKSNLKLNLSPNRLTISGTQDGNLTGTKLYH